MKLFKSEVRLQKIDFLIRNPDYLAYELLEMLKENNDIEQDKIKIIVKKIYNSNEPELRREEMMRYFFGAYEDIDDIISFLCSFGFLKFKNKVAIDGRAYSKSYYLTDYGISKIQNGITLNLSCAKWYIDRCILIKDYFGDMSGTELKIRQYTHAEYSETLYGDYIKDINVKVKLSYKKYFGEDL